MDPRKKYLDQYVEAVKRVSVIMHHRPRVNCLRVAVLNRLCNEAAFERMEHARLIYQNYQ